MAKRKKVQGTDRREKDSLKNTAPAGKKKTPEKSSAEARKENVAQLQIDESGSDWPF